MQEHAVAGAGKVQAQRGLHQELARIPDWDPSGVSDTGQGLATSWYPRHGERDAELG